MHSTLKSLSVVILLFLTTNMIGQSILPPVLDWTGESEKLIVANTHPWVTPTEKSGFVRTPDYVETMAWLKKLANASPIISMVSIGKSVEGRDIYMVIASTDKLVTAKALRYAAKPLLLVQA
ncbi:MAG TPA: M14 family zinc carboxypeptidase, partial [Saprospiraceae bacterium]|nr:M14 family zinc carboxypeptidase [Saprospiraceae bacterium]